MREKDGETWGVKDVMNREGPHRTWRRHVYIYILQCGITVCLSEQRAYHVLWLTWFVFCGVCMCGFCNVWCVHVRVL